MLLLILTYVTQLEGHPAVYLQVEQQDNVGLVSVGRAAPT